MHAVITAVGAAWGDVIANGNTLTGARLRAFVTMLLLGARFMAADQLDTWCGEWALERRRVLGINPHALRPQDRLGKLNSTLGQVMDERAAAGESSQRVGLNGHINQNWPESYMGVALEIHHIFLTMDYQQRELMDAHYCWKELAVKEKAPVLKLSVRDYWTRLTVVKAYLQGRLYHHEGRSSAPSPRFVRFSTA